MNHFSAKTKIIAVVLLAGVLPVLVSLAGHLLFGDAQHVQEPLHECFELAGTCIAIGVALLLLLRLRHENASSHLLWVVAALVAMGLVDGVHSQIPFGVAFSWTRHGATLVGGVIFALIWLPLPAVVVRRKQRFILMVAVLAMAGALAIWWWPERLPAPWVGGDWSRLVIAANVLGGLGFLAAALFFLLHYVHQPRTEDLVFASQTLLFSVASMFFGFSSVWAADWWVWHGFRLLAYAIVLVAAYETVVTLYQKIARYAQELEATNATLRLGITDRKRAEEALRETNEYLENLFNYANAPIIVWDPQFRITRFNHAFESLTGRSTDEVIGQSLEILFPSDQVENSMELIRKTLSGERWETVEISILHLDGSVRTVLWNSANVLAADGKTPVATIAQGQDITERKQAEDTVRRSARELAVRNRIADVFLAVADEEMYTNVLAIMLEVMESKFGVFGYIDENGAYVVPTMTRLVWDKCQVPDKRFVFPRETWGDSTWPRAIREKRTIYLNEPSTLTPEGHITITRHISLPLIHQNEVVGLIQVANKETDYAKEDIALLETIGRAIAPVLDARLKRERQEETLRRALADLERSNKELEQFAYVASHDLQEPLRMVASFSQLLGQRYSGKLDKDADDFIRYAVDGANCMQALINDLLSYSRVSTRGKALEPTDMETVLARVHANLLAMIEETGTILVHDPLPTVKADESQMVQLFQNLVQNAIKFRRDESPRIHVAAQRQGDEWVFSVRDNGIGIDAQYFDRIFVIFQRLHGKEEYPGTGIGLAICRRILERHAGRIWVESEPGRGSTFYFALPAKPMTEKTTAKGER